MFEIGLGIVSSMLNFISSLSMSFWTFFTDLILLFPTTTLFVFVLSILLIISIFKDYYNTTEKLKKERHDFDKAEDKWLNDARSSRVEISDLRDKIGELEGRLIDQKEETSKQEDYILELVDEEKRETRIQAKAQKIALKEALEESFQNSEFGKNIANSITQQIIEVYDPRDDDENPDVDVNRLSEEIDTLLSLLQTMNEDKSLSIEEFIQILEDNKFLLKGLGYKYIRVPLDFDEYKIDNSDTKIENRGIGYEILDIEGDHSLNYAILAVDNDPTNFSNTLGNYTFNSSQLLIIVNNNISLEKMKEVLKKFIVEELDETEL